MAMCCTLIWLPSRSWCPCSGAAPITSTKVAIHANTYGVYPEEIAALQKDYAALWEPLSDLLEKLAEVVGM